MKRKGYISLDTMFMKIYNMLVELEYKNVSFVSMVFIICVINTTSIYIENSYNVVEHQSVTKSMAYSVENDDEMYKIIDNHFEWSNISRDLVSLIFKIADSENFDRLLLISIVFAESNFKVNSESHVGAKGLIQLMPGTAEEMGLTVNATVDERLNPEKNLKAGVQYIKKYKEVINSRLGYCDMELALAGYNCGPGRVIEEGKVPDIEETQKYVNKILSTWKELQDASIKIDA